MPLLENILSDINVDKEEKCDLFFDTKESVEKEFGITIDDSLARKMSELIDKPTEAKIPRTVEKAVQIFMILNYLSLDAEKMKIIAERYIHEGMHEKIKKRQDLIEKYPHIMKLIENNIISVNEILQKPEFSNIDFKNIKKLDLSNQKLNSLYDFPFQDLEELESFDASYNKLQRPFLSILCKCKNLKEIRLHHNDIKELTVKGLLRLPQGFLLDVSYNKIKDFPDVKLQWKENCFIDLCENPLTETAKNKILLATQYSIFHKVIALGRAIPGVAARPGAPTRSWQRGHRGSRADGGRWSPACAARPRVASRRRKCAAE